MEGKVAVVTGGAEGMGKALAMKFLEQQAKGVAILDFNEEKGKATVQELQNQYGDDKVLFVRCDVKSKVDMEGAFDQVMRTFGHLNVVCNNAGIYDEINWEETVDTNLKGVIRGTYLAVQHMGTKHGGDGGIVINTASSNGFIVNPVSPVYGTTKHAVIAFTRNVANVLRHRCCSEIDNGIG
ncbi:15-hydroxyprostaglandin dehydrogenase [NAD(+)]-like isoform X2 [Ptychodera flava]|uniref:15-hydroxyprostaglandin dehydrogenase [NAD(+)]-like isoform X2 n=1 Tax=Ptychodera flava TaxID=63121 RepID=UPI003969F0BC